MKTTNERFSDTSFRSRPAAFGTTPGSGLRRAIVLALASITSLVASSAVTTAYAAEECYKDTAGRIVSRRRPGFVEVACPWRPFSYVSAAAAAAAQPEDVEAKAPSKPAVTPISDRQAKVAALPRRT